MYTEQKFISEEIKQIINKEGLVPLFLYTGVYNYQAVNSHLITLKQYLGSHISQKKTIRDSYNILVECLENINKHGVSFKTEDNTDSIYGYVIFASESTRYSVWVGNFISEKDFVSLKNMFDEISGGTDDSLREMYRNKLSKNELSEKQGMGIGIIDVLLKSKEPVVFHHKKFDDKTYFFSLEITIQN